MPVADVRVHRDTPRASAHGRQSAPGGEHGRAGERAATRTHRGAGLNSGLDRHVDPVRSPREYQQLLLGYLGDRDPAEVQAELPDQLAELIEAAGPDISRRPEPGEWSVQECMAHLLDAEIVVAGRYRWTVAEDEPPMIGYDQDRWVERVHRPEDDPQQMLAVLRSLRAWNIRLWSGSSREDRARVGMHSERGPESFDLLFRLVAGHGLFHLRQAERALRQVQSQ